jgi:hypothetical protein
MTKTRSTWLARAGEESRASAASSEGAATAPSKIGFGEEEEVDGGIGVAFSSLALVAAEEAITEDLERTTLSLPGSGLNFAGMDSHVLRPMMVALTTAEGGREEEGELDDDNDDDATILARASTAAAFDSNSLDAPLVVVLLVSSLK